jgi:competence protein CoiA
MKFALVNGGKVEASKGARGLCQGCGTELIARCGETRINHWAHKGHRICDQWWENETEWHRAWKGQFPVEWQEVIHRDNNGEKHIADVKTDKDWVLEFQHSYLKPEERRARDAFYQKLVWIVDGTRRKTDGLQFAKALNGGSLVHAQLNIRSVSTDKCALLREWSGSQASVFFDFAEANKPKTGALWWLLPDSTNGKAFVLPFSCVDFIKVHQTGTNGERQDFGEILEMAIKLASRNISLSHTQILNQFVRQPRNRRLRRTEGFQQYMARKQRARSRRRF